MTELEVERDIPASAAGVWALLRDFPRIDAFNPNLSRSIHVGGTPTEGLGAERRCDMRDGRNWIAERVIEWREGEGYTIEVYAGTLPIRDVMTTLAVRPAGANARAVMRIRYRPALGLLGRIADALVLRRVMRGAMHDLLAGLEDKARELR